jgi:hypothetical protein
MADDREPRTCADCGAVNPWMNETCRVCGAPVTNAEPEPSAEQPVGQGEPVDEDVAPAAQQKPLPRRQLGGWNPRWVLVGGALFALLFMGGEKLIEHVIVANDPELKQVIEDQLDKQAAQGNSSQEVSEGDKQRLRSALMANRALVVSGLLLMLLTPLLVGGVVGFFTAAARNGAVACGLGMVAVMLMSTNAVLYGLVFGLVYGGLGALGALAGSRLRIRRSGLFPTR